MDDDVLLRVENLSKKYTLHNNDGKLKEIDALNNISFELKKNQSIGLIGKNGSGKSTLLKIIAGYIKPSSGKVEIFGKINSLIEVGSNFIADLSGRENVKQFLQLNHVPKTKIDYLVEEIKQFSELETYFEQPVKYYSSGMFVRLSVSAGFFIDANIFLIDEVLMAGDTSFREKVSQHFKEILKKGAGVIIASHNWSEIALNCDKAIWFNKGELQNIGKVSDVIEEYYDFLNIENLNIKKKERSILANSFQSISELEIKLLENKYVRIKEFRVKPIMSELSYEKGFKIQVIFNKKSNLFSYHPIFHIYDVGVNLILSVLTKNNEAMYNWNCSNESNIGEFTLECKFPEGLLIAGTYYLELAIGAHTDNKTGYAKELFKLPSKLAFEVSSAFGGNFSDNISVVVPQCKWSYNFK